MDTITNKAEINNAIQLLEAEQALRGQLLKEQIFLTYETLKPVSILKGVIKEITTPPMLTSNIAGTVMGLVSGFLTKKVTVGSSGNIYRNIFGSVVELGVTNLVAGNIGNFSRFILNRIIRKRKKTPDEETQD